MRNTVSHSRTRTDPDGLIPPHGGYRHLKTFQLTTLIYDITVLFCGKLIDPRSRTHDQMIQAARSGRQNIAEGSMDSGTSRKSEMKLTGIAKGSLVELKLDFEDFLRQRGLPMWPPDHPALLRLKAMRCSTLEEFRAWVADDVRRAAKEEKTTDGETQTHTDAHGLTQTGTAQANGVRVGQCQSVSSKDLPAVLAANGALTLLNLCIYLLDKQLKAQAAAFEKEGGFTERLYRRRSERRNQESNRRLPA